MCVDFGWVAGETSCLFVCQFPIAQGSWTQKLRALMCPVHPRDWTLSPILPARLPDVVQHWVQTFCFLAAVPLLLAWCLPVRFIMCFKVVKHYLRSAIPHSLHLLAIFLFVCLFLYLYACVFVYFVTVLKLFII